MRNSEISNRVQVIPIKKKQNAGSGYCRTDLGEGNHFG